MAEAYPTYIRYLSMTKFDGSGSVKRWLRTLKEELGKEITPGDWLEAVDARLEKDAARWASRTHEVRLLLLDETIEIAIEQEKQRFIELLKEEYPENERNTQSESEASTEIKVLKQQPNESLSEYYKRTLNILLTLGGKDLPAPERHTSLSRLELHTLEDTI